jgi:hypothetical protein
MAQALAQVGDRDSAHHAAVWVQNRLVLHSILVTLSYCFRLAHK